MLANTMMCCDPIKTMSSRIRSSRPPTPSHGLVAHVDHYKSTRRRKRKRQAHCLEHPFAATASISHDNYISSSSHRAKFLSKNMLLFVQLFTIVYSTTATATATATTSIAATTLRHRQHRTSFVPSKNRGTNTNTHHQSQQQRLQLLQQSPFTQRSSTTESYTSKSCNPHTSNLNNVNHHNTSNQYNGALLNRIISGRKSDNAKWRRKTKRAAMILGIPRRESSIAAATMCTLSGGCSTVGTAVLHSSEEYSSMSHDDWSKSTYFPSSSHELMEDDDDDYLHSTPVSYFQNLDHTLEYNKLSSTSYPVTITGPTSSNNNVWDVSRGGSLGGGGIEEEREQQRRRQHDAILNTKPVPPLTSTILRSMNQSHDYHHDSSSNGGDDHNNVDDEEATFAYRSNPNKWKKRFNKLRPRYSPEEQVSSSLHQPRKKLTEDEQVVAQSEWAAKYTSIDTLREQFGSNRNKLWGDFDSQTTRKLYHTLLPRALLELYDIGLWSPKELAPLAYEARKAAKKYARERCVVPGRVMAMVFDGFRMWRDWGTWDVEGMSWEQVWDKYETQILEEMMQECREDTESEYRVKDCDDEESCIIDLNLSSVQEEVTGQICLRILEKSCGTNTMIDRLFLKDDEDNGAIFPKKKKKRRFREKIVSSKSNETNHQRKKRIRRRNTDIELAKIRNKLETDMKDLLQVNDGNEFSIARDYQ